MPLTLSMWAATCIRLAENSWMVAEISSTEPARVSALRATCTIEPDMPSISTLDSSINRPPRAVTSRM
ncbi:hypothetical protein D3C72_847850 [compost metagenome]